MLSIYSYASCKISIKILFIFKAILLALKIDLQTSLAIISGNKILRTIITGEELNISLALAIFVSSSLVKKARFSFMLLANILVSCCKLIKGGLL